MGYTVSVQNSGCVATTDPTAVWGLGRQMVFAVRVLNIDAVEATFGNSVAHQISETIRQSLTMIFDDGDFDGTVQSRGCGAFDLYIGRSATREARLQRSETIHQRLERWCLCASLMTHEVDGARVVVPIAVRKARLFVSPPATRAELDQVHESLRSAGLRPVGHDGDRDAFIKAMHDAAGWIDDLVLDRLEFAWTPVRSLQEESCIAHYQGTLCGISRNGTMLDACRGQAAMRHYGLSAVIDIASLSKALMIASVSPGPSLVIEISASTLQTSFWRISSLLDDLTEVSSGRICFQIIPDVDSGDEHVAAAIDELHQRGIRLGVEICRPCALDRSLMLSMRPQFISIGPTFMRSVLGRPGNIEAVSTIYALAGLVAPMVVLQGIDTPILAEHARRAGVRWGQGQHLGAPSWQGPRSRAEAGA